MPKKQPYWKKREYESLLKSKQQSNEYVKNEINDKYQDLIKQLQRQVKQELDNFTKDGKIDYQQARKQIEKLDIEYYKKKAKQYVETNDYSEQANREMKLYNITMRVNRIEYLQELLKLHVLNTGAKIEKGLTNHLLNTTKEEMKRQASILSTTIDKNFINRTAKTIVQESYKGANYSQRIWRDTNILARRIQNRIDQTILQGRSSKEFARKLTDLVKTDIKKARKATERLAVTETGRVYVRSQIESYKEYGYDKLEVITEPTACSKCSVFDGNIVDVKDAIMEINIPLFHPYCRCSTAAHMDRDELDKELEKGQEEQEIQTLQEELKNIYSKNINNDYDLYFTQNKYYIGNFPKEVPLNIRDNYDKVYITKYDIVRILDRHKNQMDLEDFNNLLKSIKSPEIIAENRGDKDRILIFNILSDKKHYSEMAILQKENGYIIHFMKTRKRSVNSHLKKYQVFYKKEN